MSSGRLDRTGIEWSQLVGRDGSRCGGRVGDVSDEEDGAGAASEADVLDGAATACFGFGDLGECDAVGSVSGERGASVYPSSVGAGVGSSTQTLSRRPAGHSTLIACGHTNSITYSELSTNREEPNPPTPSTPVVPEHDVCETTKRLGALPCPRTSRVGHHTTRAQTAARVRTTVARPDSESFATMRARDQSVVGCVLELTPALGAAARHYVVSLSDIRRARIASYERFGHQPIGIAQLLHRGSRRIHAMSARALMHVGVQKGSADPERCLGFAQRGRSAQPEHGACGVEFGRLRHRRTVALHLILLDHACVPADSLAAESGARFVNLDEMRPSWR